MKLQENPAMKALAFLAAVAAFAATAIMGWYQLANYDALWDPDYNGGDGYSILYLEQNDVQSITRLLNLYEWRKDGVELTLYQEQEIARLEDKLSADNTNLRWQLLSRAQEGQEGQEDGQYQQRTVLQGNTQQRLPDQALGLYMTTYEPLGLGNAAEVVTDVTWSRLVDMAVNVEDPDNVVYSNGWEVLLDSYYAWAASQGGEDGAPTVSGAPAIFGVDMDTVFLAEDGTSTLLVVEGADGMYLYGPSVRAMMEDNAFGFRYAGGSWTQPGVSGDSLELVLWLDQDFPVADQYQQAFQSLDQWREDRELLLAGTIVCAVLGVILTAYLCAAVGHRPGRDGIYLNWFHRVPADLLLLLLGTGVAISMGMAWEITLFYAYTDLSMGGQLVLIGLLTAACAGLCLGGLLTVVVRGKAHTLWRNTLVWRACAWLWQLCRQAARSVSLVWKAVMAGLAYVLFTILTFNSAGGLWLLGSGVAIAFLSLWAFHWKKIRAGAQQIIGGNPEHHIDTRYMPPYLKRHADELNNLGQAISTAVEDRMRSEHFKAELITNVSHDLKTPLTSIINYVDLLKKEHIDNPQAMEYIEVLDRKSQRLKKLTEDLVEASKASTGSLTVTLERLDLGQLLDQASAEWLDRLEAKGLSLVHTLPAEPVWVLADGRHLWRVLDNLLSNCAKYALEGTRIYLGLQTYSDSAAFSLKNISREELNIPAQRLLERFVRGDESRAAEGSGLGLSIAQSLTELQHGRFEISIDGDLFKATVTLPRAPLIQSGPDAPEDPAGEAGAGQEA